MSTHTATPSTSTASVADSPVSSTSVCEVRPSDRDELVRSPRRGRWTPASSGAEVVPPALRVGDQVARGLQCAGHAVAGHPRELELGDHLVERPLPMYRVEQAEHGQTLGERPDDERLAVGVRPAVDGRSPCFLPALRVPAIATSSSRRHLGEHRVQVRLANIECVARWLDRLLDQERRRAVVCLREAGAAVEVALAAHDAVTEPDQVVVRQVLPVIAAAAETMSACSSGMSSAGRVAKRHMPSESMAAK